jgi:hypothetical protein
MKTGRPRKINIEDPTHRWQKWKTAYLPWQQCSCLSPFSLFLLSSNLGTRFHLRGVDLSHPEISNFRMWIGKIMKTMISLNTKIFQHLFSLQEI